MNQQQELFCQSSSGKEAGVADFPELSQSYPYHIYNPFWPLPFYHFPKYPLFGNNVQRQGEQVQKTFFYSSATTQTMDSDFDKEQTSNKLNEHINISSNLEQRQLALGNGEVKEEVDFQSSEKSNNFQLDGELPSKAEYQFELDENHLESFENDTKKNFKAKQETLENMLKTHQISPEKYQEILDEIQKSNSLFSMIVSYFDSKISSFKKSKEEMIKLVIRKTQRHYKMKNNCKRDDRFKKYGGFKSMNTSYLEKIFSDADFASCFNAVNKSFLDEFQKENEMKMSVFLTKTCSASNWEEFKKSVKSLDEKNKMPWPVFWINRLKKVIEELQANYLVHGGQDLDHKLRKRI